MQIIEVDIDELVPYKNNPRVNEEAVDAVANSIKQFGFKVPLVVGKDNVIVAGHTRFAAARQLGLAEVPVIIADDLTDEQIKAFRLADNKTGELAGWDYIKLEQEIENIQGIDMAEFGFDDLDFSYIDSLINESVGLDPNKKAGDTFGVTFDFPIKYQTILSGYIKSNGKAGIRDMILREAGALNA